MEYLPPPLNDRRLYNYYYRETSKLNSPLHRFWRTGICDAVRSEHGKWAGVVNSRGEVGLYDTNEEAKQRAFCAAMMFEDEKSGKLAEIKRLLDQMARKETSVNDAARDLDNVCDGTKSAPPVHNPIPSLGESRAGVNDERSSALESAEGNEHMTLPVHLDSPPTRQPTTSPATARVMNEHPSTADAAMKSLTTRKASERGDMEESPPSKYHGVIQTSALAANAPDSQSCTAKDVQLALQNAYSDGDAPMQRSTILLSSPSQSVVKDIVPATIENVATTTCISGKTAGASTGRSSESEPPAGGITTNPRGKNATNATETVEARTSRATFPRALPGATQRLSGQVTTKSRLHPNGALLKRKVAIPPPEASKKPRIDTSVTDPSIENFEKAVEMRDPVTGRVMIVFRNAKDASNTTDINIDKILESCQDGCGLVGGCFFRFQNPVANRDDREATHMTPAVALHQRKSIAPSVRPNSKLDHLAEVAKVADHAAKEKVMENEKMVGVSHKLTPNEDPLWWNSRALPLESTQETQIPKIPGSQHLSTAAAKAPSVVSKKLPKNFDFSILKPIRKKKTLPVIVKRTVELVELRTLKVLVCFRGPTDASRALDVDRKDVIAACDSYLKAKPVKFETYTLRYAQPGHFAAYIYGDHPEDYKKRKRVSHNEIATTFMQIFETKKKDDTLGDPPDWCVFPDKIPAVENGESEQCIEEVDMSTLVGGLDAFSACLVCQEAPPRVVFEPCYHAVLCRSCAGTACKLFCPICHTPIQGRVEPRIAALIRPRIFPAESFM